MAGTDLAAMLAEEQKRLAAIPAELAAMLGERMYDDAHEGCDEGGCAGGDRASFEEYARVLLADLLPEHERMVREQNAKELPALKRAVRPHVDLSGERPGNTAEGLMRDVLRLVRDHPDVIVRTTVHDGDVGDMRPFYVVPQDLMRQILAAAGIDYRDIPNHRDRADLTLITKEKNQ
ncbi:hypothetical protein NE236_41955 [Actinoallomurus purpureus]|uniref:hypothetical protein n=1 Tax=Actinoallomurus purpureus TaxID=478114 RepID=UPI002092AF82|nr:hypothetical protein [Actinoallomurus purpureus]MCO6011536.1 hypothetical protein [Actinoallomurus purpureus]